MDENSKWQCIKRAARVIEAACIDDEGENEMEIINPIGVTMVALRESQRIVALLDDAPFDEAGYDVDPHVDEIIRQRLNKRFL